MRDTISGLNDFSKEIKNGKNVEIVALLNDVHKAEATVKISKIHSDKDHSINIKIKGKIRKDTYRTFLNYLKENIGLKDE